MACTPRSEWGYVQSWCSNWENHNLFSVNGTCRCEQWSVWSTSQNLQRTFCDELLMACKQQSFSFEYMLSEPSSVVRVYKSREWIMSYHAISCQALNRWNSTISSGSVGYVGTRTILNFSGCVLAWPILVKKREKWNLWVWEIIPIK